MINHNKLIKKSKFNLIKIAVYSCLNLFLFLRVANMFSMTTWSVKDKDKNIRRGLITQCLSIFVRRQSCKFNWDLHLNFSLIFCKRGLLVTRTYNEIFVFIRIAAQDCVKTGFIKSKIQNLIFSKLQ